MSSDRNWLTRREAVALAGGLAAMAMIPENPVVGGTALRRQSIQSPNFVTGSTGWTINQDGSAEFNNLVVRNGQIVSGTALYYSGPPALGNLVASIAAVGGTDSKNNAYLADVTTYFISGTAFAVQLGPGQITFFTAATAAGPWSSGVVLNVDSTGAILTITAGGGGHTNVAGGIFNALAGASVSGGLGVTGGLTTDTETITSAQAAGLLLQITNTATTSSTAPMVRLIANAVNNAILNLQVAGDTNPRIRMDADSSGFARINFGPGNAAVDSSIVRTAANKLATVTADFDIATVGRGLQIAEGTNARMGVATLVGGTVTVNNTTITGSTRIFLTVQSAGGTQGFLRIASRTIGTSFTITSTSGTETSTVAWLLVEPG